jgi:hypothetical protein
MQRAFAQLLDLPPPLLAQHDHFVLLEPLLLLLLPPSTPPQQATSTSTMTPPQQATSTSTMSKALSKHLTADLTEAGGHHDGHQQRRPPQAYERRQYIGQLELLYAQAVYNSAPKTLKGRKVIQFIDNTSAVAGLVKGHSMVCDSEMIVNAFHAFNVHLNAQVYFEYVRSKARC